MLAFPIYKVQNIPEKREIFHNQNISKDVHGIALVEYVLKFMFN